MMVEKKTSKGSSVSLIRFDPKIKGQLLKRWEEFGMLNRDIVVDAEKLGYKISESALSRYINHQGDFPGILTEKDILFLCCRWGVVVQIQSWLQGTLDVGITKEKLSIFFPETKEHLDKLDEKGRTDSN